MQQIPAGPTRGQNQTKGEKNYSLVLLVWTRQPVFISSFYVTSHFWLATIIFALQLSIFYHL